MSRHPPDSSGNRADRASLNIHGSCRPTAPVRRSARRSRPCDVALLSFPGSTTLPPTSTAEPSSPIGPKSSPTSPEYFCRIRRSTFVRTFLGHRCHGPMTSPLSSRSASIAVWFGGSSTPFAQQLPPASSLCFSLSPTLMLEASLAHSLLFSSRLLYGDTPINRAWGHYQKRATAPIATFMSRIAGSVIPNRRIIREI